MTQGNSERCNASVRTAGLRWPTFHECGRPVFEDGKCKIHCATAIAARRAKSYAAWKEKFDNRPAAQVERLTARCSELTAALSGMLAVADETELCANTGSPYRERVEAARAALSTADVS